MNSVEFSVRAATDADVYVILLLHNILYFMIDTHFRYLLYVYSDIFVAHFAVAHFCWLYLVVVLQKTYFEFS